KTLRLFVRTLELGTIAAAAEREHIAAAAVSKRIRDLEEYLGTDLVHRSNKGLEATPAGVKLLELAHRILNELESVRAQMHDYASGVQGHVTLYANISAINQFVPAELSRFVSYYPQISLQLEESLS